MSSRVYRLDVELGTPVAASDPFIHLDSFLAYAAGIESVGYDELQQLDENDPPEYFTDEMPLDTYVWQDDWVWASSAAQIATPDGPAAETGRWNTTRWRKRFDIDLEHQVKRTQVNTTSGQFKSYNAALPYNATDKLIFFFEGDPDVVGRLIRHHISGIGKKQSQGFGFIRDIAVQEAEEMTSAIYHDGHVLRSLPASFLDGTPTDLLIERRTVRPPYWHVDNQTLAVPPFEELSLEAFDHGIAETIRHG